VHRAIVALTTLTLLAGCASTGRPVREDSHVAPAPRAEDEAALRSVHVEVLLDGKVITSGHGTFIRPGIVATAVHVVDHVPDYASLRVRNRLGASPASPHVGGHRDHLDGALLYVHEPASMGTAALAPPLAVCTEPLRPGQRVLISTGDSVSPSHGSPDLVYRPQGAERDATQHLTHELPPGASGSGVFAETGCLAGLVSQVRRQEVAVASTESELHVTRITPAAELQVLVDRLPRPEQQ
jgi:hypothetical protein